MSTYRPRRPYEGRQGDRASAWDILAPVLGTAFVGLVCLVVVFGIIQIGRSSCYRWGEITGREVQYRRVSIGAECFVKTSDGHWLPKDSLREVVD